NGAFDYILKPWDNEKLLQLVSNAVDESRKRKKKNVSETKIQEAFIGKSDAILQAYKLAEKVALTDANVLILGANGHAKSFLAQDVHEHSKRKDRPLVPGDLGTASESLLQSEPLGYAKRAYPQAKTALRGRVEMAQSATIFLDES